MTRGRRLTLASGACMGMFLLLFGHVAGDATTILSKARPEEGRSFQGNTTLLSKVSSADNAAFSLSSDKAGREEGGSEPRGGKEDRGAAGGFGGKSSVEGQGVGVTISSAEVERSSVGEVERLSNLGVERSSNLGVDKSSSLGVDKSSSLGVDKSSSLGVEKSSNLGVDKSLNLGVEKSSNLGVEKSSNLGVDKSLNLGVEKSSNLGVDKSLNLGANKSSTLGIEKSPTLDIERSSTLDPGRSKPEEGHYESSGKSSSTKASSQDVSGQQLLRTSRANGLTTASTKLEEVSSRQEEATSRHDEKKDRAGGTPRKEDIGSTPMPRLQRMETEETMEQKSRMVSTKERSHDKDQSVARNTTTSENSAPTEDKKSRGKDQGSKNSEALDLAKAEGKEEVISLINDTNVNYSHYHETGNQSSSSIGGENFISKDTNLSHQTENPKEEVEVVNNVTRESLERIQLEENPLEKHDYPAGGNGTDVSNQGSGRGDDSFSVKEAAVNLTLTPRNSTEKPSSEVPGSTLDGNASSVPRGRTISFSGANDFAILEAKTTAASKRANAGHEKDLDLGKKNTSAERTIDQKPYPYLRSTKETSLDSSSRVTKDHAAETTEETSAYENTIGRGQSERKFVVTEPSVVIENSIQQFRTIYEKSGNDSRSNSTTESHSTAAVTTISLSGEVRPTKESSMEGPEVVTAKANAASRSRERGEGGEQRVEAITEKVENFDVTGNGITEISPRPEIPVSKDPPRDTSTLSPLNNTLETSTKNDTIDDRAASNAAPNLDVQTDAEESLLIRSTLNVTEVSTEYPLTKENFTQRSLTTLNSTMENSTSVPSTIAINPVEETTTRGITTKNVRTNSTDENSTMNATLASFGTQGFNGTNEIPGGESTLNPDEVSPPTTTNVEYVFVGLTETTQPSNHTSTERTTEEAQDLTEVPSTSTTSTIPESTTRQYSIEDYPGTSTMNPEDTTEISLTPIDGDAMEPRSNKVSTTPEGEETIDSTASPTTKEDFTLRSTTADDPDAGVTDETSTRITIDASTIVESTTRHVDFTETFSTLDHSSSTSRRTFTQRTDDVVGSSTQRVPEDSTWSSQATLATERTSDATQALSPDEITSLVRIVLKGSLQEVCPHQESLKQALADMLREGVNKPVSANQIRFHQNPCLEPSSPAPTPTDASLTSILVYVVDEEGKFDGAMTNILPNLYNASPINFPVTIHSFLLVQETDSGNAIAVVVVSSVAFICLVLLAGLLFIMRKRQTRFNYGERCRPVSLDAYSLDSVSAYNSVRRKGAARSSKRSYGNPTFEDSSAIPSHPLNFAGLSSFCNDVNAINEEFSGIPQVSAKIDELPAGAEVKNRYANVIPLPETRVPLQKTNNDPLTEYINASYVRGPKNAMKYYIACQGPLDSTVTDFWRMIWEQQCKVIIMLTDLVENGVEKCTEYIPPSEVTDCHRLYGDHQVTLKKRETKEKYAISTLHLKNLENNTFREVFHIWYLWPVSGVQSDGAGLIAVLLEARALQRGGPGPIVVHCSPGTGRTGTLIALDLGIRQYEITRTVDVPRVVYTIRRDRAGAVQTKEQYAFIYKALNLYATKLAGGVLDST